MSSGDLDPVRELGSPARRRALLTELVAADDARRDARRSAIVEAVSDGARDERHLALRVAAEEPGSLTLADLRQLLSDDDTAVRSRVAVLVAGLRDAEAVRVLTRAIAAERDHAVLDQLVRSLAESVERNRPLRTEVADEVRSCLGGLSVEQRRRHRFLIDAIVSALESARPSPTHAAAPADGSTDPLQALFDDLDAHVDQARSDETGLVDPVLRQALESGPDDGLLGELVDRLPDRAVTTWLRLRLADAPASEIEPICRLALRSPGAELIGEVVRTAATLPDGPTRRELAALLGDDPRTAAYIASLQSHERADERRRALALALLLQPEPGDAVARALRDHSASVRLDAAEAAARLRTEALDDALAEVAVRDPSASVRLAALGPLGGAERPVRLRVAAESLAHADVTIRTAAVSLLGDAGADEVHLLAEALADDAAEVVRAAARMLAARHADQAAPVLWQAMVSGRVANRDVVVEATDLLPASSLAATLHHAVRSDDPDERALGLQIAARLDRGDEMVAILHDALTDPAVEVRLHALEGLAARLDAVDVDRICDRVRDPAPAVRVQAVRLLRSLADDRGLSALLMAASDPTDHVRATARDALLDQRGPQLVAELISVLDDPALQRTAHELLIELDDLGLDPMLDLLASADESVRDQVGALLREGRHVPELIRRLGSRQLGVREVALDGLAAADDPDAVPAIARCLDDPVSSMRRQAARVLADLGDARAVPPLRDALLSDPDLDLVPELEQALRVLDDRGGRGSEAS